MSSVTTRIKSIKQPRGGYVKPAQFAVREMSDPNTLNEKENVHPVVIGMAVDYLSRYMMGASPTEAFAISFQGAFMASKLGQKNAITEVKEYLSGIKGIDNQSIINACKLVTFDVWLRNPLGATLAKIANEINPDINTIENIRIMVERSLSFGKNMVP